MESTFKTTSRERCVGTLATHNDNDKRLHEITKLMFAEEIVSRLGELDMHTM